MTYEQSDTLWNVDLAMRRASRGAIEIHFEPVAQGLKVAFLAGADCSLEEQCLIAGEAIKAINVRMFAESGIGQLR